MIKVNKHITGFWSVLLIGSMLCVASCRKDDQVIGTSTTSGSTSTTPVGSAAVVTNLDNVAMLKLINDVRQSGCTCGTTVMPPVAALTWNDALAGAALGHSKEMNATGVMTHNSADGTSFSTRITAAGYKWRTVGENVAAGQTTLQQVFNAWMNSEGHCKNIMGSGFKEIGAARDGNYWTQDFGAQ